MKAKSWIKYLIYMCLILIIVFWGQHVFWVYKQDVEKTFNFNPYFHYGLTIIFYAGIGLLLGLEHLLCEMKKEGTWRINLPKIALMGIPALYFSLGVFIYYSNITVLSFPIQVLIKNGTNFINTFQIILGHSIITSFYKINKDNTNINIS